MYYKENVPIGRYEFLCYAPLERVKYREEVKKGW